MFVSIFQLLLKWWPVSAMVLVAISWWLGRRERSWRRHAAMLLLVLLVPLLLVFEGISTGCATGQSGEHCYWYGFGLTVALLVIVPASVLLLAIGACCARWLRLG